MKQVTQAQIARKAKVSRTTVSLVLNNQASRYRIKPATQRKVLGCSRKAAYAKNMFATYLKTKKTNLIGIIGGSYNIPIRQLRQNLIAQYFKQRGFQVLLQDFHWAEDRVRLLREMEELRPEGIVVAEAEPAGVIDCLRKMKRKGTPVVLVDGAETPGFDQVRINREKVAYLGTRHLLEQGYDQVFYTLPEERFSEYWAIKERYKGFRRAHAELKGKGDPNGLLLWNGKEDESDQYMLGYRIGEKHFPELRREPVGVMALNDQLAIGLMKFLLERNASIPEGIGLAGSENLPESRFSHVSLTTLMFPEGELAARSGDLLLRRISGDRSADRLIDLEPELIVRQSTRRTS